MNRRNAYSMRFTAIRVDYTMKRNQKQWDGSFSILTQNQRLAAYRREAQSSPKNNSTEPFSVQ
jgi:hypothetical protein